MAEHRAPSGLKAGGKKLWEQITGEFELQDQELVLLKEACRNLDMLDDLQKIIDAEGLMMSSPQGVKAHPAAIELRQQRVVLAKLLAALRIPTEDVHEAGRDQRRVGIRQIRAVQ